MITHPLDDLPAHALGILDPEERRAVDAHLEICGSCRDAEAAFGETAWTIAEMASRDTPPRLRRAIVSRAGGTIAAAPPSRTSSLWTWLRPPRAVPVALAVVLVVALAGYGFSRRDADPYATAVAAVAGAKVVPLALTDAAVTGTRGSLVVPANGATAYLILDLPAAPPGKTWEAWVIRGGTPVRAGITDARGVTTLQLAAPLQSGDRVAITPEPPGGVDAPTGAPVLTGQA